MIRQKLGLSAGGLMRCCVQSVDEWVKENPKAIVPAGTQLECRYCRNPMVVDEKGVIHWDRLREEQR
jgi:hypothetical protein